MSMPEFSNPFVYAQFNMRGGWKNTLIVAAGYAVLVIGLIAATAQASNSPHDVLSGWAIGLLVIQSLTLVMYGCSRVSSVVRADIKSGLMESHRLMPTAPFAVVAGYIVGAPIQALFMAIVTFVVGAVVCPAAQIDVARWVVANLMLLAFSLMIWTLTMQLSLSTRGGVPMMFISMVFGGMINGSGLMLPAMGVVLCPIISKSIFKMTDTFADFSFAYICALIGQGLLTGVCFLAAVRRYRRPDEPAYSFSLGLALLIVAVGLSLLGMVFDDQFRVSFGRIETSTELIASVVLCMATALVPLSAAARRRGQWQRDPQGVATSRPRVPTPLAAVLSALIICTLFRLGVLIHRDDLDVRIVVSVAETFAAALGLAAVLRWAYQAVNKAWFIVLIWIVIFWCVPLVADVVHRSLQDRSDDPMGMIASLSPIGTYIIAWTGKPRVAFPGVLFALAIPILPTALMLATRRRQRSRKALTDALQAGL